MKKAYSFTDVSTIVRCHKCNKPLKLNLIKKHEDATGTPPRTCYKCKIKDRLLTTPGISKTETRKIMRELTNNNGLTRTGAIVWAWTIQIIVYAFIIGPMIVR